VSSTTSSAAKGGLHFPSLDGIRAASFLVVFAAHAGLERFVPGGFGVTVFFFLSGYLITTLLRMEEDASGTVSLGQFYLRRALRILPPFYLVLGIAATAATVGLLPGGVGASALFAQMLHLANYWIVRHGYDGQPWGTGVYWSLAVEEHFYVVFPVFYLVLRGLVRERGRQAVILWALCAVVLAWRCWLVLAEHAAPDRTYVATDTRVDSILFGCALAVLGKPKLDGPSRSSAHTWKWVLLPASIGALILSFVFRNPSFRETFRYTIQGVALVPVFIAAMRYPTWAPFRMLNHRAISFLGVLSYPLYLVHHIVLNILAAPLGLGAVHACVAFVLSFALAWVIHEVVEKPCAQLRRRFATASVARTSNVVGEGQPLEARSQ